MDPIRNIVGDETNIVRIIQLVGEYVDTAADSIQAAKSLVDFYVGEPYNPPDSGSARIAALFVAEQRVKGIKPRLIDVEMRVCTATTTHPYLKLINKPQQYRVPTPIQTTSTGEIIPPVIKPPKGSKKQRTIELYAQNPNMSTKDFIELLVNDLGISKACATTYAYNAKKDWKKG